MTFLLSYRIANPNYGEDFCIYGMAGCRFNMPFEKRLAEFLFKPWVRASAGDLATRNSLERFGGRIYRRFDVLDAAGGEIFRIWARCSDKVAEWGGGAVVADIAAPAAPVRIAVPAAVLSNRTDAAVQQALDAALSRHERGEFRAPGLVAAFPDGKP